MPGTVRIIGHQLFFRFPYDPEINSRLRTAAENRVRWDSGQRGFTLLAESLSRSPSLVAGLTRFIIDNGFTADPEVRRLLAFREVQRARSPSLAGRPRRTAAPEVIGPRQLRADLLPSSTWGSNLRGVFSPEDWDSLRIPFCLAAANRCEVCGAETFTDSGRRRRPDCHELWIFEHESGRSIQRLETLIALCPDCHRVQHIGRAGIMGETDAVIAKLREVNRWTLQEAQGELIRAQAEYARRQQYRWDLDLSILREIMTIDGYPDLYIPAADRGCLGNSYYRPTAGPAGCHRPRRPGISPDTLNAARVRECTRK